MEQQGPTARVTAGKLGGRGRRPRVGSAWFGGTVLPSGERVKRGGAPVPTTANKKGTTQIQKFCGEKREKPPGIEKKGVSAKSP